MKLTLFITAILLCFFLPACGPVDNTYTVNGVQVDRQAQDLKRIENILTDWVLSHSERISSATAREIVRECMKTKYPHLMLAIIELESIKFTPGALSKVGAIGFCQVRYEIHGLALIKVGIIKQKRDLWDVGPNVQAGNLILMDCLKRSNGDVSGALTSYLGGKDVAYLLRILGNHANLIVLTR